MDSGLKERLVGAAVLVALGVWLIPWILDGRAPEPATTDPVADAVELPAPESQVRTQTRTIALDADSRGSAPADLEPEPSAAAADADAGDVAATTRAAASQATAAAMPPPEREPGAAAAPAPKPSEPAATPAPAVDGWYVQLGSFGDADNAKRLAARVATFGYKAEVSSYRSGGRTLNRVRVGPSRTREEASVVASSLAAHGFVAQVVPAD